MAKKDKNAAYDDFLADLKATVGDEKWSQIEEGLIKNEKAAAKLRDGILARSEFSSQMDALKTRETEVNEFLKKESDKIAGWQKWYGDVSQEVTTAQDQLKQYKELYGELEAGEKKKVAQQAGLSTEEFERRLNEEISKRDVAALKFVDDLTDLKLEHRERFKEKLDTASVYKIAGERNLPLDVAYSVFIADKVESLKKTEFDEAIKKAKEEGASEALAKHNLPVIDSNPDVVHVLDDQGTSKTSSDRVSAAVASFLGRGK